MMRVLVDPEHYSIPEVCAFQIVLESGSEDSQPGLILPSGEIN
jgi:hypothetical protein